LPSGTYFDRLTPLPRKVPLGKRDLLAANMALGWMAAWNWIDSALRLANLSKRLPAI
jgi:hypothetical protein